MRRWAAALARAGAEVVVFGAEVPPQEIIKDGLLLTSPPIPYVLVGSHPMQRPNLWGFLHRAKALRTAMHRHRIDLAHPIHLTPFGVWTYASGFRPYAPFAMGADVLEYRQTHQARPWLDSPHTPLTSLRVWTRRQIMPRLLRPTIRHSDLCLGDNYTICESIKFLGKSKTKIMELPAGIQISNQSGPLSALLPVLLQSNGWVLSPRGANRFYQADIILRGFWRYLEKGGTLGLILLGGLYGTDHEVKRILKSISKSFSEKIIHISNKLSTEAMAALWQVVTGFISAPSYDGYSYAVAEGRAAGAVPLLNAIPGNLEIATHGYNALLIHPFTPANLAQALMDLEQMQTSVRSKIAEYNQAWIRRFSDLEAHAKAFLSEAHSLIQSPTTADGG